MDLGETLYQVGIWLLIVGGTGLVVMTGIALLCDYIQNVGHKAGYQKGHLEGHQEGYDRARQELVPPPPPPPPPAPDPDPDPDPDPYDVWWFPDPEPSPAESRYYAASERGDRERLTEPTRRYRVVPEPRELPPGS